MKLIVGLGNIGAEYAKTRHNIGFLMLDHLCYQYGLSWAEKSRFKAEIAEGEVQGVRVLLAKPLTFMNASGEAVRSIIDFHKSKHHDVLVIHDDADIDFGKARIVQGRTPPAGGGGHKGIISLYQHGLDDVWRLKIGVSNEHRQPGQAIDFVLTRFEQTEWDQLSHLAEAVSEKAKVFIDGQISPGSFTWL